MMSLGLSISDFGEYRKEEMHSLHISLITKGQPFFKMKARAGSITLQGFMGNKTHFCEY